MGRDIGPRIICTDYESSHTSALSEFFKSRANIPAHHFCGFHLIKNVLDKFIKVFKCKDPSKHQVTTQICVLIRAIPYIHWNCRLVMEFYAILRSKCDEHIKVTNKAYGRARAKDHSSEYAQFEKAKLWRENITTLITYLSRTYLGKHASYGYSTWSRDCSESLDHTNNTCESNNAQFNGIATIRGFKSFRGLMHALHDFIIYSQTMKTKVYCEPFIYRYLDQPLYCCLYLDTSPRTGSAVYRRKTSTNCPI